MSTLLVCYRRQVRFFYSKISPCTLIPHTHILIEVKAAGDAQLVKVAAQLLANIAASGAVQAAAVWRACWPGAFQCMAAGTCLGRSSAVCRKLAILLSA